MATSQEYWQKRYNGLNAETYNFSNSRPFPGLASFCKDYLREDAVILDLGCGGGRNTHYLAQQGYKVCGVDLASGAVEFCRKRFALHHLPGTFEQGEIDHIPFPDHCFDAVICISTIDHAMLETARAAIVEIRRVLKSQGVALLTFDTPNEKGSNPDNTEICSDGTIRYLQGNVAGMLFHLYSNEEIKALLGEENIISFGCSENGDDDRVVICH